MTWGFINCRKPSGVTSRGVVNRVQRVVRPAKVGHGGTLDPLATGVLVIAVGAATRLITYVQQLPKRYCAEFLLGRSSDTDDIEGRVEPYPQCPRPDRAALDGALARFVGTIEQTPPAYSAVKIDGKRAYALAREGKNVDLAPRRVQAYALQILAYDYPRLIVDVCCGSGFYVRSLGRDLATAVDSRAVMSALERQAVGPFQACDAVSLKQLDRSSLAGWLQPALTAVAHLPRHQLTPEQLVELTHGRPLSLAQAKADDDVAAVAPNGDLAAMLRRKGDSYRPWRNFVAIQASTAADAE